MAPELTQEAKNKKGYVGPPVDMWAFGALLYEMLHSRVAFHAISEQQLHQRIRVAKHAPIGKHVNKEMRALLTSLLTVDPHLRLEAHNAARHACFERVDSLDSRRDEAAPTDFEA